MALSKQKVQLSFTSGVDTKTDNKQLQLGVLETAENVAFENPGKIKKINGYESLPNYDVNDNKLMEVKSLASYTNELDALTHDKFYAYSENIKRWIYKGKLVDISANSTVVVKNEKQQDAVDCAYVENTKIFAYAEASGVRYTVVDSLNDTVLVYNQLISATGIKPRVGKIGNNVFIIYSIGTSIFYKSFNIVNPSVLSSQTTLVNAALSANNHFDIASTSNEKITLVYNATGDVIEVLQLNADLSITSPITITGESGAGKIDVNVDYKERLLVTYYNGTAVKFFAVTSNFASIPVAPTVIETLANVTNCTAQFNGTTIDVYYEVSAAATYNYLIRENTISYAAAVGTPAVFLRSVGLLGKAIYNTDITYLPVVHSSILQSSYFIVDGQGAVVSLISSGVAGGLKTYALPKLAVIDSNTFLLVSQIKGRVITDNGTFSTLMGVNSTELVFNSAEATSNKLLANTLHLPSGILYMYDGARIVEHGYFLYPENLSATSAATTGFMTDGTYQYVAVYSYTDAKGLQHQSAPSVPVQITLSAGTSTEKVTVVVPTLRLTAKSSVVIDLYRTENAGTIFYKVTTVASPVSNTIAADTVSIVDTLADSSLISRETLYTTGGVLDNIIAPQASIVESLNNRLFLAGLEDSNKIQYSKVISEGKPVEFSDTLYTMVNPFGGKIISLIGMDDKLIILKESALYYMSGTGPNNLGEENSFNEPELISSDMGCTSRDGVVLTSQGILFKSDKGIYQLSRDLSITYIGAPVEKYNHLTITSSDIISNKNVIRFTTSTGICLVYNYYVSQWATYTNMPAQDAVIINGEYFYLRTDSNIYKENSSYSNNGTSIPMKIETGWLNLNGNVQGFQRVYRMLLLGEFKSTHKLKIKVAYDYKEVYTQEVLIDVADFIDSTTYGNYTPYGSETSYGGDGNLYQLRVNFAIQKCKAMKISIEDVSEDAGESMSLSSLLFQVGVKTNMATVDKVNSFGTR